MNSKCGRNKAAVELSLQQPGAQAGGEHWDVLAVLQGALSNDSQTLWDEHRSRQKVCRGAKRDLLSLWCLPAGQPQPSSIGSRAETWGWLHSHAACAAREPTPEGQTLHWNQKSS